MYLKDLWLRLRALLFPNRMERELQDELDLHLAMQTRKNMLAGMSETEALQQARRQFGQSAQIMEECRQMRGIDLITTSLQDIRYALRNFRRAPLFAFTVVATIALGLGLDTALFTIFNAYYFQTVHVRDPHSLYECYWFNRAGSVQDFAWSEYREFLNGNPSFSEAFAFRHIGVRLDGRNVSGTLVTGGYFQMLGVGPELGRTLTTEDSSSPGREPVMVLSYSEWQNRFGGDPDIVGKKIFWRGYPFEVVGVARAGFTGLGARAASFWVPLTMAARFDSGPDLFGPAGPRSLSIVGRLKNGISVSQAQQGLAVWISRLPSEAAQQQGPAVRGMLISRATFKPWTPSNALLFIPILVAFSMVLLIGCANVVNMMLARAMARQREIGIRLSLGASRGRLIRQLLTESLLLAIPAGVAGFALSNLTIRICLRVLKATLPAGINDFATRFPVLSSDLRVFAFGLGVAILSALLFGLVPALQATRTNIVQVSRGDFGAAVRPSRLRNVLVVGQITVCVVLLITAGILLEGIYRIRALDGSLSSKDAIEIAVQERFRTPVLDRLFADPDLETIGAAEKAPTSKKSQLRFALEDGAAVFQSAANSVSPEYFALFEIPVLRGRNFTHAESDSQAAVAVVSQTTAQQLWPNQDPLGRSLRLLPDQKIAGAPARYQSIQVVGVVRDEISRWISNGEDKGLVYFPASVRSSGTELFVHTRGSAEAKRQKLDADITAIDPLAVNDIERLQIREWVQEEAFSFQIGYWLSSAIGVLAFLLTLSGIYGVVAFAVSQRTQEIGIRMAMGATALDVTSLFLRQSAGFGLIGSVLGCAAALGISKILASVLVGSNTFDGLPYLGVVLLVLGACIAAAYFPSRRAAHTDPNITLRYD